MLTSSRQIPNLDELRKYVNETLCEQEQLEIGVFPLTERILTRNGRPCGIFFCLFGPRSVKFTAIWETDSNSILFYDSTGERFLRTRLIATPSLVTRSGWATSPGRTGTTCPVVSQVAVQAC
jgi:hypothetical protein